MKVVLPIRVTSTANLRMHWRVKANHTRMQREGAYYGLLTERACPPKIPLRITLTRLYAGRGRALDSDNLPAAFKAIRDGVADFLGVDDGHGALEWVYRERRELEWGCEVSIEPGAIDV